jgi:glucokinase
MTIDAESATTPVLGADIGGTYIKWVRLSGRRVLDSGSIPTPSSGPDAVVKAIAGIAVEQSVSALGVAVPGHLTPDLLRTTIIPNLNGNWDGYALARALREATCGPVSLVNDARAFAFAELTLGAARWRPDAVFLTLGTGVGGAIALDGVVLRGTGDRLGEICSCGASGCLEAYAGSRALLAAWSRGGRANQGVEELTRAGNKGDPDAQLIFDAAGRAIGSALGSVLALFGFRTAVIGGGVAAAFELMRPTVAEELKSRASLIGPVELLLAELGPQAGAIGAALHIAVPGGGS